jgi:hypothetical protein
MKNNYIDPIPPDCLYKKKAQIFKRETYWFHNDWRHVL